MDARHAHIVEAPHLVAEELRGERRLLGHGQIARAGAGDGHHSVPVGRGHAAEHDEPRRLVVGARGDPAVVAPTASAFFASTRVARTRG